MLFCYADNVLHVSSLLTFVKGFSLRLHSDIFLFDIWITFIFSDLFYSIFAFLIKSKSAIFIVTHRTSFSLFQSVLCRWLLSSSFELWINERSSIFGTCLANYKFMWPLKVWHHIFIMNGALWCVQLNIILKEISILKMTYEKH